MTKHTQGPWYIEHQWDLDDEGNGYVWAIRAKGGDAPDLRLSEGKNPVGVWKHYVQNPAYANSEANARLIASAPEMLGALEEIVCDIESYCEDWNSDSPTDVTVALPKLRRAIAKARGE